MTQKNNEYLNDFLIILNGEGKMLGAIRLDESEDPHIAAKAYPGLNYKWKGEVFHATTTKANT